MAESGIISSLVRRVRRRAILQLFLEQGNLAFGLSLLALIFLLLAGTQILDWYWPLLLAVAGLGFGYLRLRRRIPSDYETAQVIDSRIGSHDALSTALFYSDTPAGRGAELVEDQRRHAESIASGVDYRGAVPLVFPKHVWASLGLFAVAAGLLVVRYGTRGSLDLSQPLVHLPFDFLTPVDTPRQKNILAQNKMPDGVEAINVPTDALDADGERKKTAESEMATESLQSEEGDASQRQSVAEGKSGDQAGDEGGDADEKGEGKSAGDEKGQQEAQSNAQGANPSKSNAQNGNQNPNNQNANNSSMMDKMRDAMANLMSRMKMNPQGNDSQKQSAANQGAAQAGQKQNQGQKGSPTQGKSQGEGQQSDDAGEQQGEGNSQNLNADAKNSDAAGNKQQAQEGKSGAGKQDGEKDIRNAEQQAAMGKISELLGKRAKDMTGEIMVEVSSGRQQLKTQLTQRNAAHAESGGEISRDEVPAAYQHFVQQYFEQIRKSPAAAPVKKP